jgi:hypothetical protein
MKKKETSDKKNNLLFFLIRNVNCKTKILGLWKNKPTAKTLKAEILAPKYRASRG